MNGYEDIIFDFKLIFYCFSWKREKNGKIEVNSETNKQILEFVCIKRGDTDEWAIPGVCWYLNIVLVCLFFAFFFRVCVILVKR